MWTCVSLSLCLAQFLGSTTKQAMHVRTSPKPLIKQLQAQSAWMFITL